MEARIIQLPKIEDPRGNLSYIQAGEYLPFDIERCYWIYDVPGGKERYGRALRESWEAIVALSGSFDATITDAEGNSQTFHLCRGYNALIVPPMHWRELLRFSTNSVALTLASNIYDEADYIRSFSQFLKH